MCYHATFIFTEESDGGCHFGIEIDLEDSILLLTSRYSSAYDIALELKKVAGIGGLFSQALLRFRHIIQDVVKNISMAGVDNVFRAWSTKSFHELA
jgi:hypothetical protein